MPKSISSRELVRMLEADGWSKVRQKGSHQQFKHARRPGRVTVTAGQERIPTPTLRRIYRQAGWDWGDRQ